MIFLDSETVDSKTVGGQSRIWLAEPLDSQAVEFQTVL